ncbi:hypothetical protein R3P38DRAFT_3216527 [Favolaschia claudopus]|uniref:Uncharacterized protein n=1 Tax=Favolaschia claudopus TaxID=2862362 RepID=A0AAW0A6E6_9AGAR
METGAQPRIPHLRRHTNISGIPTISTTLPIPRRPISAHLALALALNATLLLDAAVDVGC